MLQWVSVIGVSVDSGLGWRGVEPSADGICDITPASSELNIPARKSRIKMGRAALIANALQPATQSVCVVSRSVHDNLHQRKSMASRCARRWRIDRRVVRSCSEMPCLAVDPMMGRDSSELLGAQRRSLVLSLEIPRINQKRFVNIALKCDLQRHRQLCFDGPPCERR